MNIKKKLIMSTVLITEMDIMYILLTRVASGVANNYIRGPFLPLNPSLGAPPTSVSPCPSKSRKEMVVAYSVTGCVNVDIVSYRLRAPESNLDFVIFCIIIALSSEESM